MDIDQRGIWNELLILGEKQLMNYATNNNYPPI